MELSPQRARLMMIRWTVYPGLMGALSAAVFISGENLVLGWVLLGFCALSLAFRIYLGRAIKRSEGG